MSSPFQERYTPWPMAVNATVQLESKNAVNGFICITAGTITVVDVNGVTVLNAFPVAAGTVYGLAMFIGTPPGGTVTLAGGASGTLLVP